MRHGSRAGADGGGAVNVAQLLKDLADREGPRGRVGGIVELKPTNTPRAGESDEATAARMRDDLGQPIELHIQTKPTNPKDAVGIKKAPMSTVPAPFIAAVGMAMMEGALKYGRHNYRAVGVRSSVYYDALMRHMMAWWEGQDIDPESGLSHLVKAAACLAVLHDSMTIGNLNDDRPPSHKDGWIDELNKVAADLIFKYPEPKAAFTRGL
jgi:hypothetical protein